jgi:Tfp pilus assembly protein PilW
MTPHTRGAGLLELLVGASLGLAVLGALTAAVGTGTRLLAGASARFEAEDTADLALESLTFDTRRAGYDPTAAGIVPIVEATAERLALATDLDADGIVDPNSEETTAYVCSAAAQRLSRITGRQSLPLADRVLGCAFRYLDGAGVPMAIPAGGLDADARARIRALALDLVLRPTRLRGETARTALVALRTEP